MSATQIKTVNWWHQRLADWMLANPHLKLRDAAKHFDRSMVWISIVKNSDSFKAYFAERSLTCSDETISGIVEKTAAMTELALDAINEKLELEAPVMTMDTLLAVADTGLKRMGYGATKGSNAPQVNVGVSVVVDRAVLEEARQRMRSNFGVDSNVRLAETKAVPETKQLAEGTSV